MIRTLRCMVAAGTAVAALAIGIPAYAATNAVIAQTGGAEVTMNLLGSPFTVTVALDTTTGNISSVDLSDTTGYTATKLTPSRVRFDNTTAGTSVKVSAKRDSLSVGVKSSKLDDLVGPGTWAADVFGTGAKSSVPYTIAKNADGSPSITIGTLAPAAGVTANALAAKSFGGDDHEGQEMRAFAQVEFTNDGFRKVLTIGVVVENGDTDHGTVEPGSAKLSFTLKGRDIQRKALADLVGAHKWTGQLCEGTAASIDYTVNADGTLTVTGSTPTGTPKSHEHSTTVTFASGDTVMITLVVKDANAALAVSVRGHKCTGTPPSVPLPTVKTPVDPNASTTSPPRSGDHGGNGGKGGGGGHKGSNG